ncbi:NAD(P)H-dependent oxidoreductase [Candidatus Woesearchaeota archaeon]|nr:NAD(P)H-dependent oxidoreductase [Candidatus Woesearchaeota archaeon]
MTTQIQNICSYLQKKSRILFLTTSNRWAGDKEKPKSTLLAEALAARIGKKKVTVLNVPALKIFHCEGNISRADGNNCGVQNAVLKDQLKNPSGFHRCWASINNKDDDLWKITKELFQSDCVIFFGSVRWGQMNAYYQTLIERLSWIENRFSTLKEKNIVGSIDAGIIVVGQNWRGKEVVRTQRKVLQFYGFNVPSTLCWNWQYTNDLDDESLQSYQKAGYIFQREVLDRLRNMKVHNNKK